MSSTHVWRLLDSCLLYLQDIKDSAHCVYQNLRRFLFRKLVAHFTHTYDWWQALELAIESEGWKVSGCALFL
jgi:hypothetical protein